MKHIKKLLKNIKYIITSDDALNTMELAVIIAVIAATAIVVGSRLRGGASSSADTISNKLSSFASGGSW